MLGREEVEGFGLDGSVLISPYAHGDEPSHGIQVAHADGVFNFPEPRG